MSSVVNLCYSLLWIEVLLDEEFLQTYKFTERVVVLHGPLKQRSAPHLDEFHGRILCKNIFFGNEELLSVTCYYQPGGLLCQIVLVLKFFRSLFVRFFVCFNNIFGGASFGEGLDLGP